MGLSAEYREYEQKAKNRTEEEQKQVTDDFMQLFAEFGEMKSKDPASKEVQEQVMKLKDYITDHFYQCSNEILSCLGGMYSGGGDFTENIDRVGGTGTAEFTDRAIQIFCK